MTWAVLSIFSDADSALAYARRSAFGVHALAYGVLRAHSDAHRPWRHVVFVKHAAIAGPLPSAPPGRVDSPAKSST